MKKKRHIVLASLLAFACLLGAGFGVRTVAFADVSATLQNNYVTSNVARGKTAKYTEIDGTEIPREQLLYWHREGDPGYAEGAFDPYTALTDNDHEPGEGHSIVNVVQPDGSELRCFAVIDLEQAYTVTGLNVDFWHDHDYIEVVVQVANSADFSDAVTVCNNDTANEMKCGAGTGDAVTNLSGKGIDLTFSPVYGRYVRVSGRDTQGGVKFTEIEVRGVTSGLAPVAGNLALEQQGRGSVLALTTEIAGADIYYTTDGTVPTQSATPYTAPIDIASIGNHKAYIRAVAVKDGVATVPSDFRFKFVSQNVAFGVIPTFDEGVNLVAGNGDGAPVSSITDGKGGSFHTVGADRLTWLYLDLGKAYTVDKVATKFWNDHTFKVIIQVATNDTFTENVYTVFNNDRDNSVGVGKGYDGTYQDKGLGEDINAMNVFAFYPVSARYVRVWAENTRESKRYSLWEEIQVFSAAKPVEAYDVPAKNVALGITPTFDAGVNVTADGNTDIDSITDGIGDSFNFMKADRLTWLYLDLGKEYTVDKVATKFWNDHTFKVVIQVATDENFTENLYTVFNNDTDNSVGAGVGSDGEYRDSGYANPDVLQEVEFEAVPARYVRVWAQNTQETNRLSSWEEVQVWCTSVSGTEIPEEEYPARQGAVVEAKGIADFSVANGAARDDFADKLPATIRIKDDGGVEADIAGTWGCDDYNAAEAGEYTFVFTPATALWIDVYGILRVTVTVAPAADKTGLTAAITAAHAYAEENYVSSSWATLADSLAAAEEVNGKRLVLQAEVDAALADLQSAVSALKLRGDKTELLAAVTAAEAIEKKGYTQDSYRAFETALAHAKSVAENIDAEQDAIDEALAELTAKQNALAKSGKKGCGSSASPTASIPAAVALMGVTWIAFAKRKHCRDTK